MLPPRSLGSRFVPRAPNSNYITKNRRFFPDGEVPRIPDRNRPRERNPVRKVQAEILRQAAPSVPLRPRVIPPSPGTSYQLLSMAFSCDREDCGEGRQIPQQEGCSRRWDSRRLSRFRLGMKDSRCTSRGESPYCFYGSAGEQTNVNPGMAGCLQQPPGGGSNFRSSLQVRCPAYPGGARQSV